MLVKKFLHSCILLEENGRRLLFDPGLYCFIEKRITFEDIGAVDAVVITHSHPDHFYPEALKFFTGKGAQIIASKDVVSLLDKEGLRGEVIEPNEEKQVAGFTLKALEAPHGPLPVVLPHNFAFLANDKFLHPGDSLSFPHVECQVFAMPVAAPWLKLQDAVETAKKLKPKAAVPIHDAIIKDFTLEKMYELMCKPALEKQGIGFSPLAIGEELEC